MAIKISLVEQVSSNVLKKMEKGLLEYELGHGIHVDYTPFAFEDIMIKMRLLVY